MSSADDPKRQADAPDAPDAKKPKPAPAAIYDDIAVDYAAVRANPFKRHVDVEEATFLRAVAADGAPPDPEESYMEIVGVFTARLA